jgi:hypothetical protein
LFPIFEVVTKLLGFEIRSTNIFLKSLQILEKREEPGDRTWQEKEENKNC